MEQEDMQTRKRVGDSMLVRKAGLELLIVCVTPKITDLIPHARQRTCSVVGHHRQRGLHNHIRVAAVAAAVVVAAVAAHSLSSAASLWRFSEWLHVWHTAPTPVY